MLRVPHILKDASSSVTIQDPNGDIIKIPVMTSGVLPASEEWAQVHKKCHWVRGEGLIGSYAKSKCYPKRKLKYQS